MKTILSFVVVACWSLRLTAADTTPKEALVSASKNLGAKSNYSWKTSVEIPGEPTGTIEGKAEKDGAAVLALARAERSFSGVLKGSKGAIKTEEGWKSLGDVAEDTAEDGATRFVARLLQNFKAPPGEVADLAGKATDLKLTDGVYAGGLNSDTVKELILFRSHSGNNPDMTGVKGSIKFWVKDGTLAKYEYNLQATISLNGNDREINRTHTTEITEVGSTKVTVPDPAAKLL